LLLGAVYVVVLFSWELSVTSAIQEIESTAKKEEVDSQRLIQRMVQRQGIVDTIMQDFLDERISLDQAASRFRDVSQMEPATIGFICVSEGTIDQLEASRRHLLRMTKYRQVEKVRHAERLREGRN
jgi:hypothetical protein